MERGQPALRRCAIRKRPGEGKNALLALLSVAEVKLAIVTDDDINIYDWARGCSSSMLMEYPAPRYGSFIVSTCPDRQEACAMEYRPLGTTGLEVSVIGLGCNHLGSQGPGRTRADMIRLLECAADRGVTFYDTADVYMEGESERLLGEVFGRRGRQVVIATKVGLRRAVPHGLAARVRPFIQAAIRRAPRLRRVLTRARHILTGQDYSADYLRRAVEGSLTRLQADTIDLLQLHSPPASVIQRDDAFETLDSLRSQGKIRFYGVSFGSWREAAPRPEQEGLSTLQIPISLVDEAVIDSLMRWARHRGVGIIGNQPFKKGRLLGADMHARLGSLLHDGKRSLAQAMLRFVAQLDGVSTVITGTSSIAHLGENIEALDSPPLSAEEIERLRAPGWALESEP